MRVPALFGDGMILQRRKPLRVWGTASPGAEITVDLEGSAADTTTADAGGQWQVVLAARESARGLSLSLSGDGQQITFGDIGIGEVWIAGGQSNMEFLIDFDIDRQHVYDGATNTDIRFFDVPKVSYPGQQEEHDYSAFGWWRNCTPENLRYFSAVGFYFAQQLQAALDVPIGIVGCNWGGTPAAAWTTRESVEGGAGSVWFEEFDASLFALDLDAEAAAYRAHRASDRSDPFRDPFLNKLMREGVSPENEAEFLPAFRANFYPQVGSLHPYRPGGLFETMVRTIVPFAARGVIWYQGESDIAHPEVHCAVLQAMMTTWRRAWLDPGLPFLITQLAPFGSTAIGNGDLFPVVREQQALAAQSIPQVWIASSSDAGAEYDIHPKNKRPIGERLALLARRHVYGEDVRADAPELAKAEWVPEGVELHLRHAYDLHVTEGDLPFDVIDARGDAVRVDDVRIRDGRVTLTGPIPVGSRISFAKTGYYRVGLRNGIGLPAFPFEVEV